jgi:hypothetical protein
VLLPFGIRVVCFDFSGSGLSDGDYVSLGVYEKDDLRAVVQHVRAKFPVSTIGLWGRSMGAATAIMYAVEDPTIAGMVLDSPFSRLTQVMQEIVKSYKSWIPSMVIAVAIKAMKRSIEQRAKFDITDCDPLSKASHCYVPALFGHALDDDFIKIHHSEAVFQAYGGDKNFVRLPGDHNSDRPNFWLDSVCIFFHNTLVVPYETSSNTPSRLSSARPSLGEAARDSMLLIHAAKRHKPASDVDDYSDSDEDGDAGATIASHVDQRSPSARLLLNPPQELVGAAQRLRSSTEGLSPASPSPKVVVPSYEPGEEELSPQNLESSLRFFMQANGDTVVVDDDNVFEDAEAEDELLRSMREVEAYKDAYEKTSPSVSSDSTLRSLSPDRGELSPN